MGEKRARIHWLHDRPFENLALDKSFESGAWVKCVEVLGTTVPWSNRFKAVPKTNRLKTVPGTNRLRPLPAASPFNRCLESIVSKPLRTNRLENVALDKSFENVAWNKLVVNDAWEKQR